MISDVSEEECAKILEQSQQLPDKPNEMIAYPTDSTHELPVLRKYVIISDMTWHDMTTWNDTT